MAQNVVLNGVVYQIPDVGEDDYGQNLTNYFVAIAGAVLQKTGGNFALTADVNFGSNYGVKSKYFSSRDANPATDGLVRLTKLDSISWRNNANVADLLLSINGSDQLTFGGVVIQSSNLGTPSRAVVTDASGNLTASATTDAEIGYVSGVTSSIQTQLNAKVGVNDTQPLNRGGTGQTTKAAAFDALSPMSALGDLIYGGASGTGTRLPKGSDGQILTLTSGAPTWVAPASANEANLLTNLGLATSVGSNALTIALKQADGSSNPASGGGTVTIGFRSSTVSSGGYNLRNVTGALSLVVSSGSTLGTKSGSAHYLYVYALDNAGTVELGISQAAFDDGSVQSSTAEGGAGASDSGAVIYSTTARSNVPVRLIGRILITEATAGTWASNATEISLAPSSQLIRTVGASYNGQPTGTLNTSFNPITYPNKVVDTNGNYSGGTYTVTSAGFYNISAQVDISGTYAANKFSAIAIYINGTRTYNKGEFTGSSSNTQLQPAVQVSGVYLNVGDLVTIQATTNATTPVFEASTTTNFFSIVKAM